MPERMWFLREASWHNRPTSGPKKYHLERPDDKALALCVDAVLDETSVRKDSLLHDMHKCRRCLARVASEESPK